MVLPPVTPIPNATYVVNPGPTDYSPWILFGIPSIIIVMLSMAALVLFISQRNSYKQPALPQFEPVMVRRSTLPPDSV